MTGTRVLLAYGTRPNVVKVAALHRALAATSMESVLLDTGQHYDDALSGSLCEELGLPPPAVRLGIGRAFPGVQASRIAARTEAVLRRLRPDVAVVVGDVTSTRAVATACARVGILLAHVEAGLRSRDFTMPEERNRIVTDHLADPRPLAHSCHSAIHSALYAKRGRVAPTTGPTAQGAVAAGAWTAPTRSRRSTTRSATCSIASS